MKFLTEVYEDRFFDIFKRFEEIVESKSWHRAVVKINQELQGNSFLSDYQKHRYRIIFTLDHLKRTYDRNRPLINLSEESTPVYETCALIAQFVDIYGRLDHRNRTLLSRRLSGALRNNADDLRGLQFELQMATNLVSRGYDVEFPETDGNGVFDILAERDGVSIEVECKSVSEDKGRQVHRREAIELHNILHRGTKHFFKSINCGLAIRIIFPGRPSKSHADRLKILDGVKEVLLSNKSIKTELCAIELVAFELERAGFLNGQEVAMLDAKLFMKDALGIDNRECAFFYSPNKYAVIFSIESYTSDRVLNETMDTVSRAADRQLTGTRPGIVMVKFEGITASELQDIGGEDGQPSALRIAASEFLNSNSANNVTLLSFFADGTLGRTRDNAITRTGKAYYFQNDKNSHVDKIDGSLLF